MNIFVNCYNELEVWKNRKDAENFYLDCMANSDGAEKNRYTNIYLDLKAGQQFIYDDDLGVIRNRNIDFKKISDDELYNLRFYYNFYDDFEVTKHYTDVYNKRFKDEQVSSVAFQCMRIAY